MSERQGSIRMPNSHSLPRLVAAICRRSNLRGHTMFCPRSRRSPAALLLGLVVAACSSGPPSVVLDTASGAVPLFTPQSAMPGAGIAPPPGLDPAAPAPAQTGDRSGTYAGVAVPLNTGGGICIQNRQVTNFRVRGRSARFGGFRGTIAPDGIVEMAFGQDWIVGQFDGPTFNGHLNLNGRRTVLGCTYMLTLHRVGP